MTKEEFAKRITAMTGTLYRVSYGLLKNETDREEAVQETILRAWEQLSTLRQERFFQTWVVRILINQCYAIGRENSRLVYLEEVHRPDTPAPEERSDLRRAILALETELRLPVILHYIEGYALREIGEILDIPLGTVKSRLHRARHLLRHHLEKEAQEI